MSQGNINNVHNLVTPWHTHLVSQHLYFPMLLCLHILSLFFFFLPELHSKLFNDYFNRAVTHLNKSKPFLFSALSTSNNPTWEEILAGSSRIRIAVCLSVILCSKCCFCSRLCFGWNQWSFGVIFSCLSEWQYQWLCAAMTWNPLLLCFVSSAALLSILLFNASLGTDISVVVSWLFLV